MSHSKVLNTPQGLSLSSKWLFLAASMLGLFPLSLVSISEQLHVLHLQNLLDRWISDTGWQ